MNNFFSSQRIKVIVSLVITFLFVKYMVPEVFLLNTPRINPIFIAKLLNTPTYLASLPGKLQDQLKQNITKNQTANIAKTPVDTAKKTITFTPAKDVPPNLIFTSVAKGVAAADVGDKRFIKIDKGTEFEITYKTKNGKTIKVLRPKK